MINDDDIAINICICKINFFHIHLLLPQQKQLPQINISGPETLHIALLNYSVELQVAVVGGEKFNFVAETFEAYFFVKKKIDKSRFM